MTICHVVLFEITPLRKKTQEPYATFVATTIPNNQAFRVFPFSIAGSGSNASINFVTPKAVMNAKPYNDPVCCDFGNTSKFFRRK